jgi:hypothetical protein
MLVQDILDNEVNFWLLMPGKAFPSIVCDEATVMRIYRNIQYSRRSTESCGPVARARNLRQNHHAEASRSTPSDLLYSRKAGSR